MFLQVLNDAIKTLRTLRGASGRPMEFAKDIQGLPRAPATPQGCSRSPKDLTGIPRDPAEEQKQSSFEEKRCEKRSQAIRKPSEKRSAHVAKPWASST